MRTVRWIPLVLVTSCLALMAADEPAATTEAPRSTDAKQAAAAYDRAVKDARKVYDGAVEKARKNYAGSLNKALDKAMLARDLEEANRIKAQLGSIEVPDPDRKPLPDLFGKRWLRLSRIDNLNDAIIRFLPDGGVEGEGTGFDTWRRDGDAIVLMKTKADADDKGAKLTLRPGTPVFYGKDAPSAGVVYIPEQ